MTWVDAENDAVLAQRQYPVIDMLPLWRGRRRWYDMSVITRPIFAAVWVFGWVALYAALRAIGPSVDGDALRAFGVPIDTAAAECLALRYGLPVALGFMLGYSGAHRRG